MKYLTAIMILAIITAAACKKKEEDRYCYQCTRTTDINYLMNGVETTSKTQEDTTACGLTEAEMRELVSSNKLSFSGVYQGVTAKYSSSMQCAQK